MTSPGAPSPLLRCSGLLVVLGVVLFVALAAFLGRMLPDSVAGEIDFVEYAAAARLLLAGDDPYDARRMLPLQQSVGWGDDKAQMMWNPPWVFPLVLPTGLLPWGSAFLAWDAVQLVAVVLSAVWCWKLSGGPSRLVPVAVILALVFAPTIFLLRLGQSSGFLLLGLAGFLAALRAGRPALAGVAVALTAVKPHLFLPFAVLLACDAFVARRTRTAVLVGAGVLALAAVFPMLWNSEIWPQFLRATQAPSDEFHIAPSDWDPPILASRLATLTGGGLVVQFAPSVLGTMVLVGYWWVRRSDWDWLRELPRVVLFCVLTTGYGAWGFDLVVLLLPVIQGASWLSQGTQPRLALWSAAGYLVFNAAALVGPLPVLWWAPILAAGYIVVAWATSGAVGSS